MSDTSGVAEETFRVLARRVASTVTVVTALRRPDLAASPDAPELDGFTATAFLMLSITPPLIAVSASKTTSAASMLRDARAFSVNVLAEGQADIAAFFALPHAEREGAFTRFPWHPDAHGVPLLAGTLGSFSARVVELVDAGDHTLAVGEVTALRLGEREEPLVYKSRQYGHWEPL